MASDDPRLTSSVTQDFDDNASVSSFRTNTSKLSRLSIASRASKASSAAAAVLRKGLSFSTKSSERRMSTTSVAEMVDLKPGDTCETIAVVTVRRNESLDSDVVAELQVGATLDVVEIGDGRRIKVAFGIDAANRLEGWISSKTKVNEPLVMKCSNEVHLATMDFEVGGQHEVKAVVTVRAGEDLDSEYITEVLPGSRVRILELGLHNKRRVKIASQQTTGWISTATKFGEPLIGKVMDAGTVGATAAFNITSNGSKVKALLESARSGNLEELMKVAEGTSGVMGMLTSRPSLNSSDVRGKTALIYAAAFGHQAVVRYLLSKREVDVNALDDTQKCALHHASKRSHRPQDSDDGFAQGEIVNMLLTAGAYIEARDHNGCTALMFAVANGDVVVTKELLKAQANVNVKDFEGHRPLDYAINFEHEEIARMLINAGGVSVDFVPPFDKYDGGGSGLFDDQEMPEETSTAAASPLTDSASLGGSVECSPTGSPASSSPAAPKKKVVKKRVSVVSTDTKTTTDTATKPKAKAKKRATTKEGGKPKAKAKKTATNKMKMMEALGDDKADAEEVRVEEMPTEDVDLRVRALNKLRAVEESEGSPGELEAAIKVAQAEGVDEADLEGAKKKLEALRERFSARDALRQSTRARDVTGLKAAIAHAEAIKLEAEELPAARKVLKEEEPRHLAREAMQQAKARGDLTALKAALKQGKEAKMDAEEIAEFEGLLAGAESKEKALAALQAAMASLDVPQLKLSIQQARDAQVAESDIEKAVAIVKVEEPKHLARSQLEKSLDTGTKFAFQKALSEGRAAGLSASEALMQEVEAALAKEVEKELLCENVKKVLEKSMTCDMTNIDTVRDMKKELNGAITDAIKVGVAEKEMVDAEIRRKKLHNTVEDLKGSIRVFARIRPLSSTETKRGDLNICKQTDLMTLQVGDKAAHEFKFDAVFTPGTQDEIFEDCRDLVQSAVDGYNVTLFAYGQTGAGKTFTMAGVPGQLGISPRTITEIFEVTQKNQDRFNYTIMGSMLELYRTDLVDLLTKGDALASAKKLKIRDNKTGSVAVEHLTETEVFCAKDLERLVEKGTKARAVAATMMNSESSRSHLIVMVKIVGVNRETQEQTRGKILIVDLAGSERLSKSQTTGDAQKESIEINKSLTALGDVIEGLTQRWKVIPYRNHKLTMLMADALGGTAKTLMFVNCSPANYNFEETVNSLKYAQRAKNVTNQVAKARPSALAS